MNTEWQTRLKKWRKRLGIPQKQAADRLKVNLRTYQGWEEGRPAPKDLAMAELERRMNANNKATP